MPTEVPALDVFAQLAAVDGKAEIIDGEIVLMPPAGAGPG